MATYKVYIIETLEMEVEVEASSQDEARSLVLDGYGNEDYVLTADNSNVSVDFLVAEEV